MNVTWILFYHKITTHFRVHQDPNILHTAQINLSTNNQHTHGGGGGGSSSSSSSSSKTLFWLKFKSSTKGTSTCISELQKY